ncbi:MAG: serine protease [Granulosicoccus sp.]
MGQYFPQANTLVVCLFLSVSNGAMAESDWRAKPIYGADDRVEVFDAPEQLRQAAKSVALLVSKASLDNIDEHTARLVPRPSTDDPDFCAEERFTDQPAVAACSAFLVSQNLIATAAHCVKPVGDDNARGLHCDDLSIVFDYVLDTADSDTPILNMANVYHCSAVEDGVYHPPNGPDWRIVRLDRAVPSSDRAALTISTLTAAPDTPVAVLGHPRGLPMKAAGNAIILRDGELGGSVADLDTFAGNSGSPVFTDYGCGPVVVGLLSRGSEDFTVNPDTGQCRSARLCNDGACLGEQITSSKAIADYADRPFTGC